MIDFDDYRKEDGFIDWTAYHNAQIKVGEICLNCKTSMFFGNKGKPRKCYSCETIETDDDELNHDSHIRCPKCRYSKCVVDGNDYDLYSDGTHEVDCDECGFSFEVNTNISFTFNSPAMIKEGSSDGD